MSEALSSSEIEDVLSSIRRLVSDDMRPVERIPEGGAAVKGDADKLLLTPALRVVPSTPQHEDAARPIDAVVASVSAGVDQQADDWEAEFGDLAPVAQDHTLSPADMAAPMAEDVSDGDWEDHQIDAYVVKLAPPAAPEAEHESHAEVAEDNGPEAALQAEDLPGWAQTAGVEEAEDAAPKPWNSGAVEPDRAWADEAEAAVLQELSAATARPEETGDALDLAEQDEPDLPLDEAVLREIVRDVLREELQGRLGERITRNIRKLVRAEIARALASQDLL